MKKFTQPAPLHLRCYAEQQAPRMWVAVCIDLCLAAQGESDQDARCKLDAQIDSYIEEANTVDRAHYDQLIPRMAPWRQRLKYYLIHLRLAGLLLRHQACDFARSTQPPVAPHHA